eukprot:4340401-Prymnesium_polylepis.1
MRNDHSFVVLQSHQQRSTCVSSKWYCVKPTETKNTPLYSLPYRDHSSVSRHVVENRKRDPRGSESPQSGRRRLSRLAAPRR